MQSEAVAKGKAKKLRDEVEVIAQKLCMSIISKDSIPVLLDLLQKTEAQTDASLILVLLQVIF